MSVAGVCVIVITLSPWKITLSTRVTVVCTKTRPLCPQKYLARFTGAYALVRSRVTLSSICMLAWRLDVCRRCRRVVAQACCLIFGGCWQLSMYVQLLVFLRWHHHISAVVAVATADELDNANQHRSNANSTQPSKWATNSDRAYWSWNQYAYYINRFKTQMYTHICTYTQYIYIR